MLRLDWLPATAGAVKPDTYPDASLAQWQQRSTHNGRDAGSIPARRTINNNACLRRAPGTSPTFQGKPNTRVWSIGRAPAFQAGRRKSHDGSIPFTRSTTVSSSLRGGRDLPTQARIEHGELAEWTNAPALKTGDGLIPRPRVRISHSPPEVPRANHLMVRVFRDIANTCPGGGIGRRAALRALCP